MNIYITIGVSPFLLSIENKEVLYEGQESWATTQTSPFVQGQSLVCTQVVYDAIKDKVGTINAPALIANANANPYQGRQNVYIENGSLKLLPA